METDIFDIQCGSPAGMGQLIKYFESQSRRLDKQKVQPSCVNSDFESCIRFNGVPILPPVITSGRSEELRLCKKDAVLLEKRLKARQRRNQMAKNDSGLLDPQAMFPENSRPTARQIDFDTDMNVEGAAPSSIRERLGATNPMSTFATAETTIDDFGLQTMDTLNSDFMSMEGESAPTVFSGFKLNSYKEQKISYDLDRLSRILNVNELNSTSGSDISDAIANTQTLDEDLKNAAKWAEKVISQKDTLETKPSSTNCLSHENEDKIVKVSPDMQHFESVSVLSDNSIHAQDQTNNSITSVNSSPVHGFGNTVDSQRSSRSSPKSLKNAVHFASFVTEYINTSASQSLENTTIVTKKLPSEQSPAKGILGMNVIATEGVLPIIGDPNAQTKKTASVDSSGMLNHVSINPDSDSPCTPPSERLLHMPFEGYSHTDAYSSDKENEGALRVNPTKIHRSLPEEKNPEAQRNSFEDVEQSENVDSSQISHEANKSQNPSSNNPNIMSACVNSQNSPSISDRSGAIPTIQKSLEYDALVKPIADELTTSQMSVSDSQGSNRSNILTATSESSSSTIMDDLSVKENSNLAMNIVDSSYGHAHSQNKSSQQITNIENVKPDNIQNNKLENHSPKKLNVDPSDQVSLNENEINTTPLRRLVRSGSYTLKEPSPALLKARSRLEAEDRRRDSIIVTDEKSGKKETIPPAQTKDLPKKHQFDFSPESNIPHNVKNEINIHLSQDTEKEGKAEHINKYLSQVQFQNSMSFSHQSWNVTQSDMAELDDSEPLAQNLPEGDVNSSVVDLVQSLSENGQIVDVLQLTKLHQLQMEKAKQEMIEKQELEMEELFVQQRRDTMLLAAEIKAAQELEKEQQEFLIQNAPENIKVKSRGQEFEYSPEHSRDSIKLPSTESVKNSVKSLHNLRPRSHQTHSSSDSGPNVQLKSYPVGNIKNGHSKQVLNRKSPTTALNTSSDSISNEIHETRLKTLALNDSFSPRHVPPVSCDVPYFSHSPNSSVIRSPIDSHTVSRKEVYSLQMKPKFDRISAVAKGFLTRCLIRSDKVQELVKTIKDTRNFAFDFQTETPIKKGVFTSQDRALLERIVAQLQAALLDIHEIFFEIPIHERMMLIEQTRMKEMEKRVRNSKDSVRDSGPRISQATLKALERKRKAREAEKSAMLSKSVSRPVTATSSTISPRSQNYTDTRALKPLQGQGQMSSRPDPTRSEKDRPRTAPEKQLTRPKRILASGNLKKSNSPTMELHKESIKEGGSVAKQSSSAASKFVLKAKVAPSKLNNARPTKSWR